MSLHTLPRGGQGTQCLGPQADAGNSLVRETCGNPHLVDREMGWVLEDERSGFMVPQVWRPQAMAKVTEPPSKTRAAGKSGLRGAGFFPRGPDAIGRRGTGLTEGTCFISHRSWKKDFPSRSPPCTPMGPRLNEGVGSVGEDRGST